MKARLIYRFSTALMVIASMALTLGAGLKWS